MESTELQVSDNTNTVGLSYDIYQAKLLECSRINKKGSTKENLHIILDLQNSGINYKVGSNFGIYPENAPLFVENVIDILGVYPTKYLIDFFSKKVNRSQITYKYLNFINKYNENALIDVLLKDRIKFKVFVEQNDLISFLKAFWDKSIPITEFCSIASPMLPRFYSVASSTKKVGEEAHFMIASFKYKERGKMRLSVMAKHLKHNCKKNKTLISIFHKENPKFIVPEDPKTPIIMIGPGTGVAVFRGFLQEREHTSTTCNNWLFTGDRNEQYDFHFEDELKEFERRGILRLTTAFSRDSEKKLYVHHKMLQYSKEIWSWLIEKNCNIYICGNAKQMAKDVQETLCAIFSLHGNLSPLDSKKYLKTLTQEKRLSFDIY